MAKRIRQHGSSSPIITRTFHATTTQTNQRRHQGAFTSSVLGWRKIGCGGVGRSSDIIRPNRHRRVNSAPLRRLETGMRPTPHQSACPVDQVLSWKTHIRHLQSRRFSFGFPVDNNSACSRAQQMRAPKNGAISTIHVTFADNPQHERSLLARVVVVTEKEFGHHQSSRSSRIGEIGYEVL